MEVKNKMVNSVWLSPRIPAPPAEYNQKYMRDLVSAFDVAMTRMKTRGLIEIQRANISNLPTSDVGLRPGDLWNDSDTVKIVP